MKHRIRLTLSVLIILLTVTTCIYYLSHHRNLITQLSHTPVSLIILILFLYIVWLGVLLLIMQASLRICRKQLKFSENLMLNIYSLFINYFIPGQGGPIMRGVYLKKHHGLRIRSYVIVTILYYLFYAIVSILMLLGGSRPWWQTLLAILLATSCGSLGLYFYSRRKKITKDELNINWTNILYLFAATLLQALVQIAIYSVELHRVDPHVAFRQSVTYTGAANLALFVGLTPGAIGIRESFLIFSQSLHHISSAYIVLANIIDRSVYLLFLGMLFIFTLVFHVKQKLQIRQAPSAEQDQ